MRKKLLFSPRLSTAIRIIILVLAVYLLLLNVLTAILLRRILDAQRIATLGRIETTSEALLNPPRDAFYLLQFLYDPEFGIDPLQIDRFRDSLAWEEISSLLGSLVQTGQLESGAILFPDGTPLIRMDRVESEPDFILQMEWQPYLDELIDEQLLLPYIQTDEDDLHFIEGIYDERGDLIGFLWLAADITQQKQIERTRQRILLSLIISVLLLGLLYRFSIRLMDRTLEAENAANQSDRLRSLGTLAAGVAHEIRNPLGIILLQIEEIESRLSETVDSQKREEIQHMLEVLREEAIRLQNITGDFLSFSRKKEVYGTLEPLDLVSATKRTVSLWKPSLNLEFRNIVLEEKVSEAISPVSEDAFRRILLNLLRNADEALANRKGKVSIEISEDNGKWLIAVSDDGPGFSEEIADQIFDPFFTTRAEGTGLGLSLSRALVEALGGTLSAKSDNLNGATFRVWLPKMAGEGAKPKATADKE